MFKPLRLFLLLLLPFAASNLFAQAPRITPRGDPSVRSDTIYSLAVDPADYPEESAAFLLDDGVLRYEADGRGVRTYRQVVQILREDAVERYQEFSFSYTPGRQRLTINWIRVVTPEGQVISARPVHVQESAVPAARGNPVYTDVRVRRASLSGVAVGSIVDFSYSTEELKPFLPGDFYQWWLVTTALQVRRSRLILDVPASLEPRILEKNLSFPRQLQTVGGRKVYTWAVNDLPALKAEPFAADSNAIYQSVAIAAPHSWQDIARWYAGLARDRYTLTPAVAARVREVVQGAATLEDSIRAVHRWVAQDIRYVSISLGLGGYQPRPAAKVFETGVGDCKDKTTLFIAALRELGVTAHPVLLAAEGGVERSLPSIDQFDHAIAAIERPEGYLYVDLTAELVPYGKLPFPSQGEFGLVVHPDGRGEEVTLPLDPLEENRTEMRLAGTLSAEGFFNGRYEELGSGANQYTLRDVFATPRDSTTTANMVRNLATAFFPGASGDSLVAFNGRDLGAEPKISIVIRNGRALTRSGETAILNLPFESMGGMADAAEQLAARGPRRFPIDAAAVIGAHTVYSELRVQLPPGWRARLPQSVSAESAFGSYASEYVQEGDELRVTRRLTGARGILPPERIEELLAWYRAIGADDVRFIVLDQPVAMDPEQQVQIRAR